MSERRICIHGHFYQPPREDPWTGVVPRQPSAAPFHDWNQRITTESYAPNAAALVLAEDGEVVRRVDNYAHISFDFGPTLLAWLAAERPEVHAAVVAADLASQGRFSGHGSAMAQSYHHTILPLAHPRDRRTEVRWGVADFRHRFGRHPEGMWLPETAVDLASLEELAAAGIRFTVLEPHQAARWRPGPEDQWRTVGDDASDSAGVSDGGPDSGPGVGLAEPYLCRLPSGASIALFFYDGPTSRDVAFQGLLRDGDRFARRLIERFDQRQQVSMEKGREGGHDGRFEAPGMLSIATDGETYGHHHRHGEMALAWALGRLEATEGVRLTNFAEHLARFPPRREVEIRENTSWSCPHGVGRWSRDCGCAGGTGPDGRPLHGRWRGPLREAMLWLRGEIEEPWEQVAGDLLTDPWVARDDYVQLLLDDSPEAQVAFLAEHAVAAVRNAPPGDPRRSCARDLLELQRNALRMFTSCAWFFEDIARIETVQVLRYAERAVALARALLSIDLEPSWLERLARAPGNNPELPNGREVLHKYGGSAPPLGPG